MELSRASLQRRYALVVRACFMFHAIFLSTVAMSSVFMCVVSSVLSSMSRDYLSRVRTVVMSHVCMFCKRGTDVSLRYGYHDSRQW